MTKTEMPEMKEIDESLKIVVKRRGNLRLDLTNFHLTLYAPSEPYGSRM